MSLKLKEDVIIDGTTHMLEITAEITSIKLDGHLFTATAEEPKAEVKQDIPANVDRFSEDVSPRIPYYTTLKKGKAPNNTSLFLEWIEQNRIREFDINDFLNEHLAISKEQADIIIIHQIAKKKLIQLSNTKFRVIKE